MKQLILRCWLLLAVVFLAACGNTDRGAASNSAVAAASNEAVAVASAAPTAAQTAASAAASSSPSAAASAKPTARPSPTPLPTPGPNEFVNPVIAQDFPDPDIVKVGDTYYAYATNAGGTNVQTAKSTDLVAWQPLGDAMPSLPQWVQPGLTWAPEVTTWDDGQTFTMYFTARDIASDKQCIGVATSNNPEGPFNGVGDKAFICQAEQGGSIDASSFLEDDGTQYVLWKNDGNCCGYPVYLYIQKVSEDGLTLEGEPTQLITNDQSWEGNLVEAPTLWKHNGKYYLLYSANSYAGADYATGWAVADTPTGPFAKPSSKPLMETDYKTGAAIGPGGQDVIVDKDGDTWIAYHSWDPTATMRRMLLDELVWENGQPVVKGPDKGPQPKP